MTNKSVRVRQTEGSGEDCEVGGKRMEQKMAEIVGEEKREDLGDRWGVEEGCDSGKSSAALLGSHYLPRRAATAIPLN